MGTWVRGRKATTGLGNSIVSKPAIVSWIVESTDVRNLAIHKILRYRIVLGRPMQSPIVLAERLGWPNYLDSRGLLAQIQFLIAKGLAGKDWLVGTIVSRYAMLEIVFPAYGGSRSDAAVEGTNSVLSATKVPRSHLSV